MSILRERIEDEVMSATETESSDGEVSERERERRG
jgi:hypothetical protein